MLLDAVRFADALDEQRRLPLEQLVQRGHLVAIDVHLQGHPYLSYLLDES